MNKSKFIPKPPYKLGYPDDSGNIPVMGHDEHGNDGFPLTILDNETPEHISNFIVKAVNSHEQLIEVCKKAYTCLLGERLDGDDVMKELRETLKQLEGIQHGR